MATITQAIATLEQQLGELTFEDGTKVLEHVYAYTAPSSRIEPPCAIIRPSSILTRVIVNIYLDARESDPTEKIVAIADVCTKRWGIGGRFGWDTLPGTVYRTFSFSLVCG